MTEWSFDAARGAGVTKLERPLGGLTDAQKATLLDAITAHAGLAVFSLAQVDDRTPRSRHVHVPDPCSDGGNDYIVTVAVRVPYCEPGWEVVGALAGQLLADSAEENEMERRAQAGLAKIIDDLLRG